MSIAAGQTLTVLVTPAKRLCRAQLSVTGPASRRQLRRRRLGSGRRCKLRHFARPQHIHSLSADRRHDGQLHDSSLFECGLVDGDGRRSEQSYDGDRPEHRFQLRRLERHGPARAAVMGTITSSIGPDGFGYSGVAIAPQFVDISGTGDGNPRRRGRWLHAAPLVCPDYSSSSMARLTLVYVNSNGMITFLHGNASFANTDLTKAPSQAIIAPCGTIGSSLAGRIRLFMAGAGTGASQRLIVQWNQ